MFWFGNTSGTDHDKITMNALTYGSVYGVRAKILASFYFVPEPINGYDDH